MTQQRDNILWQLWETRCGVDEAVGSNGKWHFLMLNVQNISSIDKGILAVYFDKLAYEYDTINN